MRYLLALLLLVSFHGYSASEANCHVVKGFYQNSKTRLTDMKFETLADIFTILNAKTLSFVLDQTEVKAIRSDMEVDRQTKLIYLEKKKNKVVRAIRVLLDRTPRDIARDREFYGNMLISTELENEGDWMKISEGPLLRYNFYCEF